MKRLLLLTILLLLVAGQGAAQSVGLAPGAYSIGDVQRGGSRDFKVYVNLNGVSRNVTIKPFVKPQSPGVIFNDEGFVKPEEYSAQSAVNWISFAQSTYQVDPSSSRVYTLPNGAQVAADGVIKGTLEVPSNAEPGYHAVQIGADVVAEQDAGFGSAVFGLTRTSFSFRVNGRVQRRIEVVDIQARRTGEEKAQFVFEMRNTGSVTAETVTSRFSIIRPGQGKVDSRVVSGIKLSPGETGQVETVWLSDQLEGGNYRLRGGIDYRTGKAFFDQTVTITQAPRDPIQVDSPDNQQGGTGPQQASTPLLLILVAVLGTGSVLYAFGVDMLWAFLLAGFAGITIFIITSGLPVYVLALMVMGAGAVLYVNW